MADSKKYDGGQWQHSLRKLTTATEAVENPLYSDGTAITSYTIKGNTVQNGTPTPSNPVEVNGVGVKTENLFNERIQGAIISSSGVIENNAVYDVAVIPVIAGEQYTFAYKQDYLQNYVIAYYTTKPVVGSTSYDSSRIVYYYSEYPTVTITIPNGITYIAIRLPLNGDLMFNTGATAKPFEPHGYKIPISNGQQTTNIYLGSTQSERQVYKMILTGNEAWRLGSGATPYPYIAKADMPNVYMPNSQLYCTHFQNDDNGMTIGNSYALLTNNTGIATDIPSWKQWLADQLTAGTPVTVWYVLATAETAAVNEPLMKIGDYADTLSNAASIPTTEGANSITVDTAVQPSEFTATWTGWHNATVEEKSENYLDENDFGLLEVAADVYRTGTDVGVLPSGKYTLSANKSSSAVQIYRTTKNGSTYNYETISELPYTFTADGVSNQIFRTAGSTETSWADAGYSKVMLNSGETAQTYESYWQ